MEYLISFRFDNVKEEGYGDKIITTTKAITETDISKIRNLIARDLQDDNTSIVILNIMRFPIK